VFEGFFDGRDVLVRQFLNLFLGTMYLVLGDILLLDEPVELCVCIPSLIAEGDFCLLGKVAALLNKLTAALLGGRREGQADDGPVV